MYNLTIHFGPNAMVWSFLFKDKEKAEAACSLFAPAGPNPFVHISDDFGQSALVGVGAVHGVLLEDLELGDEARILRGLHQARGQAKAHERARNDPVLVAANRNAQGGPGVLTPFGRNGFNG